MADESGGSFGGGASIHWAVTSGKEEGGPKDKPPKKVTTPNGDKYKWDGVDEDHDPMFRVQMRIKTDAEKDVLLTSLNQAVDRLGKGEKEIELRLPVNDGGGTAQIQVVWRPHRD